MSDRETPVRIRSLDGLRGCAVLSVFLFHYLGGAQSHNVLVHALGVLVQFGWAGVSVFFVLSGFLITGILWKQRDSENRWLTFFSRRSLRIFPLYYVSLMLVTLSLIWEGNFGAAWPRILLFVLYLQNCFQDLSFGRLTSLATSHFWSLAVEEQFYLAWPFIVFVQPSLNRAKQSCLAIVLLSLLFRIWVLWEHVGFLSSSMPARAGELAAGAWLALALRERPSLIQRWYAKAAVVFFAGILCALLCGVPEGNLKLTGPLMYSAGPLFLSLASAALIVLALGRPNSGLLATPVMRRLGQISYGIYVYHILFKAYYERFAAQAFPHLSFDMSRLVVLGVAAAGTITLAELSYRFFESPILHFRDSVPALSGAAAVRMGQ